MEELESLTEEEKAEETQLETGEEKEEKPPEQPEKEQKTVPLAALHEARAEIKSQNEVIQGLNSSLDELKNGFKQFRESLKPKEDPPVEPDPQADPFGHQSFRLKQIHETQEAINKRLDATEQQNQYTQFMNEVTKLENSFRQANPDYDNALNYLKDMRRKELAVMGVTNNEEVTKDINYGASILTQKAVQEGKNPAQVIYDMAVLRGYQKPANGNAVNQDLEAIKKGQEAAQSLSGGGDADIDPTWKALMEAEDGPEFDEMWDKVVKKNMA